MWKNKIFYGGVIMADVETYGGKCPICGKAMLQKYNERGGSWLTFDACPFCGFAYSEVDNETVLSPEKLWADILNHLGVENREELKKKLIEKYKFKEFMSEEESEVYPSVFRYENMGEYLSNFKKVAE